MVSIDMDNIIHYHPLPIPKPPCKPPRLPTSYGSSHPPTNPPILTHPLPPRPPRLSLPHRQSPPPVVSCLPSDHDAHTQTQLAYLNEFDKELADFDLAGIESHQSSGLCLGGSEESPAEGISGVQRTVPDNPYDGTWHAHLLAPFFSRRSYRLPSILCS